MLAQTSSEGIHIMWATANPIEATANIESGAPAFALRQPKGAKALEASSACTDPFGRDPSIPAAAANNLY